MARLTPRWRRRQRPPELPSPGPEVPAPVTTAANPTAVTGRHAIILAYIKGIAPYVAAAATVIVAYLAQR